MPTEKNRYRGRFLTSFREKTPSQMPCIVIFTLLYIERFFSSRCSNSSTAAPQMAVTTHPVSENPLSICSNDVPVFLKNVPKVLMLKSRMMPE